jgi:hypothetical protein
LRQNYVPILGRRRPLRRDDLNVERVVVKKFCAGCKKRIRIFAGGDEKQVSVWHKTIKSAAVFV